MSAKPLLVGVAGLFIGIAIGYALFASGGRPVDAALAEPAAGTDATVQLARKASRYPGMAAEGQH